MTEVDHDLAGALHEVSNALTVILGWVERARGAQGLELSRALDLVSARARDARRIVRGAIGASHPSSEGGDVGPPSLAHQPLRTLREVIDDAATSLDPEACRAALRLAVSIDAAAGALPVQRGGVLLQILTNLLLNAISMSPRGGVIEISAVMEGGHALLSVADEGPGVPPERRATLLRSGVTTRPGGAGIGLRHSASLAEAAGGRLSLAPSERGARFELRWPFLGSERAAPPASVGPDSAGDPESGETLVAGAARAPGAVLDGVRILLVEDDEAVVDLLDTALSARGATIVSVRHADDLPGALASGPFHAALLDISPIERDVPGAVAAVQHASPGARLVVMSGSSGTLVDLPRDCATWVRKPFEVKEIVDVLVQTR